MQEEEPVLQKWEHIHCASGPYSRTRNPLYIGNVFIYSEWSCSQVVYICSTSLIVILYFIFQYSMIISLEEEKAIKFSVKTIQNIKEMFLELFR